MNLFGFMTGKNSNEHSVPQRRLRFESLEERRVLATLAGFEFTGLPDTTVAGAPNSYLLTAVDEFGARILDYTGTVSFSSPDPQASVPVDYTFTVADRGDRTFSTTFKTAGIQELHVSDETAAIVGTTSMDVTNAALKSFVVSGFPGSVTAAETHSFSVEAVDTYGNTALDYAGTVSFSSSDSNAILPTDYTFTTEDLGTKSFEATLRNTGLNRSIIATDVATGFSGKQNNIVVENGPIRYASSTNIIYVEGVAATLSDIKHTVPLAPLEQIDPVAGIWKLDANILIVDGGSLRLHGTEIGGDVNELRMKSENTLDPHAISEIRADYGNIDIRSTKIISWDSVVAGPDTEYETFQRAFIRARSRVAEDGTLQESRMDIFDSEVGYLGYFGAEAYGLSWKVVGDAGLNFELYDQAAVYGDIHNSYIHHNYYGIYTYGAQGGVWRNNEVAHNVLYGIDPHDDSDFILIEDNYAHSNGLHGIICSVRCNGLTIRNNVSTNNDGHGIMLHRVVDNNLIEGNTTSNNARTGIVVFDGNNNIVRNNTAESNMHGIRLSMGSSDNVVEFNHTGNNLRHGVFLYQGSDPPRAGDDGKPKRNIIRNNNIYENGQTAIRILDSVDTTIEDNTETAPVGQAVRLQSKDGTNTVLKRSLIGANKELLVEGVGSSFMIDPVDNGSGVYEFTNHGVAEASAGATLKLQGSSAGRFTGNGTYRANAASVLVIGNGATISNTSLETTADGVLVTEDDATVELNNVAIDGSFQLGSNASAVIRGVVSGSGTFALSQGNNLELSLEGTDYGQIHTTANLQLGGTVTIADNLLNGVAPVAGQTIPIISTTGILTGTFANNTLQATIDGNRIDYSLQYGSNEVLLHVDAVSNITLDGDFNQDGTVDSLDLQVWREALGQLVQEGTGADANSNGRIDGGDYLVWLRNVGRTAPSTAVSSQVAPARATTTTAKLQPLTSSNLKPALSAHVLDLAFEEAEEEEESIEDPKLFASDSSEVIGKRRSQAQRAKLGSRYFLQQQQHQQQLQQLE